MIQVLPVTEIALDKMGASQYRVVKRMKPAEKEGNPSSFCGLKKRG